MCLQCIHPSCCKTILPIRDVQHVGRSGFHVVKGFNRYKGELWYDELLASYVGVLLYQSHNSERVHGHASIDINIADAPRGCHVLHKYRLHFRHLKVYDGGGNNKTTSEQYILKL